MPSIRKSCRHSFFFFVALTALLSGCSWSQAPSIDDALSAPADVIEPQSEEVSGHLALTKTGMWALVWEAGKGRSDIRVGDIVRASGVGDSQFEANYAVALTRNWGLLLQRLGGGPVPRELGDIDLTVVSPDQLDQGCVGGADEWPDSECLSSVEASAAWDLYSLDGPRLRAPSEASTWSGRLPFQRLAVAARTELAPATLETTPWRPEGRWLAIRRDKRRLPEFSPSLVADERCQNLEPALEEAGVTVEFARLGPMRDAIEAELAAATHGADAFARCPEGGGVVFVAPVAFRPLMEVPYTGFRGVPLLGWRAIEVAPDNRAAVALAGRVMAHIGSGRYDRADFYIDDLVPLLPDQASRRLALLASPIAAAAGQPELAVRRMRYGAERMWNPERDVSFKLASAWAWAAFDQPRRALVEMRSVDELIARARATPWLKRWRTWTELRSFAAEYSRRSSAEDGFRQARSVFDDVPSAQTWREAVDWLRWTELGGPLPRVTGADTRFDVFRAAARGESSNCEDCPLDAYGIHATAWFERVATRDPAQALDRLGRLPLAAVRPGLTRLAMGESAGRKLPLAVQVGLVSTAPDRSLQSSLSASIEAIGTASRCEDGASVMPARQTLAHLLELRAAQRDEPQLATAKWLVTVGLELACEDASQLVEEVVRRTQTESVDASLLAKFTTSALAASPAGRLDARDARLMAEASKRGGMPESCMLWNQAAALASLKSQRIKLAETFVRRSVDCHDEAVSEDLSATESYLGALLHYERTRRVPGQLREDVARRLAIATRHTLRDESECAGLAELDYWLNAGVSRRVARLAELIDVAKSPSEDGLQLRTASRTASKAASSYLAARRALSEGRPALAARLLREAEHDFRVIAHRPGLARVRFLIEVIYGDELDAFAEREARASPATPPESLPEDADAPQKLRRGRARAVLVAEGAETAPARARLAAALILGRTEVVGHLLEEHPELADNPFCAAESDR